jgi:hypothetical protein
MEKKIISCTRDQMLRKTMKTTHIPWKQSQGTFQGELDVASDQIHFPERNRSICSDTLFNAIYLLISEDTNEASRTRY